MAEKTSEAEAAPEDTLFGKPSTESPQQTETSVAAPETTQTKETAPKSAPSKDVASRPSEDVKGEQTEATQTAVTVDYEPFSTPEGADSLSEAEIAKLRPLAKELGLSQEQAQKLVDMMALSRGDAQKAIVMSARESWVAAIHSDTEVGGAKYQPSLSYVRAVMNSELLSPGFRALLTDPNVGLIDNPEVFKTLARIGRAISSDRQLVAGKQPQAKQKVDLANPMANPDAVADAFYGKSDM